MMLEELRERCQDRFEGQWVRDGVIGAKAD